MEFEFNVDVSPISGISKQYVFVDGERVGELRFSEQEWELFQAILLHGRTWFMDGEATVKISSGDRLHAYMEAV
jgi:hypothetical protein